MLLFVYPSSSRSVPLGAGARSSVIFAEKPSESLYEIRQVSVKFSLWLQNFHFAGRCNTVIFTSNIKNMPIQAGQKAPDFTLRDTEKNKVTLSEQKGKNVVLLFFPLAFTGVCTKELCSVRDNLSIYNDLDATVYGISVDSLQTLNRFKQDQNLNFDLLSDFNKEASTAYDAIYAEFFNDQKGVSKRSAFVIDKEGIVRYAQVLENAGDLPDFEAIQRALKEINQ